MTKTEAERMAPRFALLSLHATGVDPIPPDVMPPTEVGEYTEGWMYNKSVHESEYAWCEMTRHGLRNGRGTFAARERKTIYLDGVPLYSTRVLALEAMRREREFEFATKLHAIDLAIADAKAGD